MPLQKIEYLIIVTNIYLFPRECFVFVELGELQAKPHVAESGRALAVAIPAGTKKAATKIPVHKKRPLPFFVVIT